MDLDPNTLQLVSRFKEKSSAVSRVIAIWIPALLVLWVSGLVPKAREVVAYSETKGVYAKASDIASSRASLLPPKEILSEEETLEKLRNDKKGAKVEALLPFKLPGDIEVPIPVVWAPVAWIALVFGAMLFVIVEKQILSAILARLARKLVLAQPEISERLRETLSDAPFWLAPIASKDGKAATKLACYKILGWRDDHVKTILFFASCFVLIALEFHVVTLAFSFSDAFGSKHEKWLAPLFASAFMLASLAIVAISLLPRTLPDLEPDENPAVNSRRALFVAVVASVLVASTFFVRRRLPFRGLARNPRFRTIKPMRRSKVLTLESRGLHVNKRSGKMHYIMESGQILGVAGLNESNLIEAKVNEVKVPPGRPSINLSRSPATFELIALELIKKGDAHAACEVLLVSIGYQLARLKQRGTVPDIRTLDLLAGLAIRFELPQYFEKLIKAIRISQDSETSLLGQRVRKWQDLDSKWRKKWSDNSKKVNWCALPMQDTRLAGDERSSRSHTSLTCISV